MRVGTFPAPWGVQTSTERSEVGANTPLLRSRRQTPLWRLSACTGEVYWKQNIEVIAFKYYQAARRNKIGDYIEYFTKVDIMPGEVLDFLACLPKLKDGAIVVLHDIIMNHFHAPESFATKILLSSVVGEKIICNSNENLYKYPNIGAFRITRDTRKYIENVLLTLTVTWRSIPDSNQINIYRKCFERYYGREMCEEFNRAVRMNMDSFGKQKAIFSEGLYAVCELLKVIKDKKNVYIYGCGNYGKKLYNILTKVGIEVKGYVISDDQMKIDVVSKVDYVSDIDSDVNTYILGMSQINQNSICRKKIKGDDLS